MSQESQSQTPTTTATVTGTTPNAQDIRETIESVIRGQRRMKGTILSVDNGRCIITGELGEFPFAVTAVKQNKRFPDRPPRAGDRCDFKLSDTNPVKATSIRVIVPKSELPAGEEGRTGGDSGSLMASASMGTASVERFPAPIASLTSTPMATVNCITASSLGSAAPGPSTTGNSGIDDICNAFQRMGNSQGASSLFSL